MKVALAALVTLGTACASGAAYYKGPPRRVDVDEHRAPPLVELTASRIDATHVEVRGRTASAVRQIRTVHYSAGVIREGYGWSAPLEAVELGAGLLALWLPSLWIPVSGTPPQGTDVQFDSTPIEVSLLSPFHSVFSPREQLSVSDDERFIDPGVARRYFVYVPASRLHLTYRALDPTAAVIAAGEATTSDRGVIVLDGITEDTVVLDLAADGFHGLVPIEIPDKLDLATARARWLTRPAPPRANEVALSEVLIPKPTQRARVVLGRDDYRGPSWRADWLFGVDTRESPDVSPLAGEAAISSREGGLLHMTVRAWPYFSTHVGVGVSATGGIAGDLWGEIGAVARVGTRRVALEGEAAVGGATLRAVNDPREPRVRVDGSIELCLVGLVAGSERLRTGYCGISVRAGAGLEDHGDAGDAHLYSAAIFLRRFFVSYSLSHDYPVIGDPKGYPLVDGDHGSYTLITIGFESRVFGAPY